MVSGFISLEPILLITWLGYTILVVTHYTIHVAYPSLTSLDQVGMIGIENLFMTCMTLTITLSLLAICCHVFGIYLISRVKKPVHQHQILIHHAVSDILIAVFKMPNLIIYAFHKDPDGFAYFTFMDTIPPLLFVPPFILIMMVMLLDPALIVVLKSKYKILFSQRVVKHCLYACWVLGISPGLVIQVVGNYEKRSFIWKAILGPTFVSLFLLHVVAVVCTLHFYYGRYKREEVERKTRNESISTTAASSCRSCLRQIKTPAIIFVTFLAVFFVPTVINATIWCSKTAYAMVHLLYVIGIISNFVIYTSCNLHIRNVFKSLIMKINRP